MSEKLFNENDDIEIEEDDDDISAIEVSKNNGKKTKNNGKIEKEQLERTIMVLENQLKSMDSRLKEMDKQSNMYGQAMLKMVNLLYETPDALLSELTEIPRNAVIPLSIIHMKERLLDPTRDKMKEPISQVWRNAYFRLQRGLGRAHLLSGAIMAKEQIANKGEERKVGSIIDL